MTTTIIVLAPVVAIVILVIVAPIIPDTKRDERRVAFDELGKQLNTTFSPLFVPILRAMNSVARKFTRGGAPRP